MNRAGRFVLGLLYPNRCGCCGEMIAYDAYFCEACTAALAHLHTPANAWSNLHAGEEFPWEQVFAVFTYRGAARAGLLNMKDGGRNFGEYAGEKLAETVKASMDPEEISCVTWVPIGRRRRRMQGYSHAELLGRTLAKAIGRPARGDLLTEKDSFLRQHHLNKEDRRVFAARFQRTKADLTGQTVLLCDDVLTTGSTLTRCASLLKEAGARHVLAAVAAVRLKAPKEEKKP